MAVGQDGLWDVPPRSPALGEGSIGSAVGSQPPPPRAAPPTVEKRVWGQRSSVPSVTHSSVPGDTPLLHLH